MLQRKIHKETYRKPCERSEKETDRIEKKESNRIENWNSTICHNNETLFSFIPILLIS